MKPGIIICTRLDSTRIPRKATALVNGVPLLGHLLQRLAPSKIPIVLAMPTEEYPEYVREFGNIWDNVHFFGGFGNDPLERMATAAAQMQFDAVIRITHDKIFVDVSDITRWLDVFEHSNLDYLYSSSFVPGTGFEVIRNSVLQEASYRFSNVEHISYAIHAITDRKTDMDMGCHNSRIRLLVDYPIDLKVIETVLENLGNECSKNQAVQFLNEHPEISCLNELPLLTAYTCAYNAEPWIRRCLQSIITQDLRGIELIAIDDASTDRTRMVIDECLDLMPGSFRGIYNKSNVGLASSCNIALSRAKGKYIVRLDADDFFTRRDVLSELVSDMETGLFDVIYPDHYLGSMSVIEKGNVNHHAGGAIFSTRALNHLKFTDGLRGYEGYDLFERAKTQLRIGYLNKPTFFYTQHPKSLSKSDPEERRKEKESIDARIAKGN